MTRYQSIGFARISAPAVRADHFDERVGWSRAGAAGRRRVGAAVPWRGQHRVARDVARGRGRRAVDVAGRRRRRRRDRAGHAGGSDRPAARRPAARDRRPAGRRTSPTSSTALHAAGAATDAALHRAAARHARGDRRAPRAGARTARARSTSCSRRSASFTLLVGGAVRLRRPRDPATLHFFWLCGRVLRRVHVLVQRPSRSARLGLLLGRRDRDPRAAAAVPALHAGVPRAAAALDARRRRPRARCRWSYVPAVAARRGARRRRGAQRQPTRALFVARASTLLDRARARSTWRSASIGGLVVLVARARRRCASITARRQLRWIAWGTALGAGPFAFGYALPYALGVEPSLPMQLSAIPLSLIPLAYASAIVRYRLLDVEVIVKRALVYAAALGGDRRDLRRAARGCRSACSPKRRRRHNWVIALLATLVARAAGAAGEGRRAERARPRVLPRSLRLPPRAGRLRARSEQRPRSRSAWPSAWSSRVVETLLVDRMALMLEDEVGAALRLGARVGLRRRASAGAAASARRSAAASTTATSSRSTIRLRRPVRRRRDRVLARRRALLLRALRLEGGHDRRAGARPQGHRRAVQQRGHRRC